MGLQVPRDLLGRGETEGGASCRVSEEASEDTCIGYRSHLSSSEGRRLSLPDFKNSLINSRRRRCGEEDGGSSRVPDSVWIGGLGYWFLEAWGVGRLPTGVGAGRLSVC